MIEFIRRLVIVLATPHMQPGKITKIRNLPPAVFVHYANECHITRVIRHFGQNEGGSFGCLEIQTPNQNYYTHYTEHARLNHTKNP